ncbi:MAG: glycoside hydrolase family 26 protein [Treponema sp.]|nr:glycoside hydrolase family 26 protein [Treponema sp.]
MKISKIVAAFAVFTICLSAAFSADDYGIKNVVSVPVNKNATPEAKALMSFLADNYGKKVLSGQMDLTWNDTVDMAERVFADTGKYPAIMGYDFMNSLTPGSGYGQNQTEEAIEWAKKGGIVAFCWHWRVKGTNKTPEFYTKSGGNPNGTDFKIPYDLSTKTWDETPVRGGYDFHKLQKDMDKVAVKLQQLQDEGIPVLWRPLHEASGGWFWWGAAGSTKTEKAERYKALYRYMFDYYTNEKGLNNLIWVWNGQDKAWYPGDEYVDIIGVDIYDVPKDYSSKKAKWLQAVNYAENPEQTPKMVALTENGTIPSPSKIQDDGAWWSFFMTWNDGQENSFQEHLNHKNNFWTGEHYNTDAHKKEVYESDIVITLDELK